MSVCVCVCVCVCLKDRVTFRRIVLKNAFNKRKMYEALLESVPMLNTLDVRVLRVSSAGGGVMTFA